MPEVFASPSRRVEPFEHTSFSFFYLLREIRMSKKIEELLKPLLADLEAAPNIPPPELTLLSAAANMFVPLLLLPKLEPRNKQ